MDTIYNSNKSLSLKQSIKLYILTIILQYGIYLLFHVYILSYRSALLNLNLCKIYLFDCKSNFYTIIYIYKILSQTRSNTRVTILQIFCNLRVKRDKDRKVKKRKDKIFSNSL